MEFSPVAAGKNILMDKTSHHNAQLLDRVKLDGYLLSLLSNDLFDTLNYASEAKEFILKSMGIDHKSELWNSNSGHSTIHRWEESSPTGSSRHTWWQWKDLLAVFTIWASRGQTPGARALGFDLFDGADALQTGTQNRRFSFWWWIAGSSRKNSNRAARFRYKILLYGFLRIVLPRIYERIKSMGLEYANYPIKGFEDKVADAAAKKRPNIRKLAVERRKLVIRAVFQWLDKAILPSVKLAMLLSCWAGSDSGHGGDLALWVSGLSYQPTTLQGTNTVSTATIATIPLFVLYAHRRWFHREAVELLWKKFGRSILLMQRETTELGSAVAFSITTEWKMLMVRWSYKLKQLSRNIFPNESLPPTDSESRPNEREDEPCAICGAHKVVVPYRLGCCGTVACYVCLWERLASTANHGQKVGSKMPCPICFQNISKCEPA